MALTAEAEMDKVEKVARALCAADGMDPDEAFDTGEVQAMPMGDVVMSQPLWLPRWHGYRKEAGRFIAASEALNGTITSGG